METYARVQKNDSLPPAVGARGRAMNVDVAHLIERLESLVATGRRVPLSAMVMVDEQAFLDMIDQLRVAWPEEVKQARRVTQERDRVISHAQTEAEKIIRAAEAEAAKMLEDNELVKAANERAKQIIAEAEARAQELRRGADNYVLEALTGLDEELSRLLAQIRRGRAMLERPRDSGPTGRLDDGDASDDLPRV